MGKTGSFTKIIVNNSMTTDESIAFHIPSLVADGMTPSTRAVCKHPTLPALYISGFMVHIRISVSRHWPLQCVVRRQTARFVTVEQDKMKLSFLCCCIFLLAITPVLLYPTDGAGKLNFKATNNATRSNVLCLEETVSAGNNSSESDGDVALDDGDDENEQPVAETEEQITTTPKSSEEKNKNHRRRPNKRPKNRYNQLHQNGGISQR